MGFKKWANRPIRMVIGQFDGIGLFDSTIHGNWPIRRIGLFGLTSRLPGVNPSQCLAAPGLRGSQDHASDELSSPRIKLERNQERVTESWERTQG